MHRELSAACRLNGCELEIFQRYAWVINEPLRASSSRLDTTPRQTLSSSTRRPPFKSVGAPVWRSPLRSGEGALAERPTNRGYDADYRGPNRVWTRHERFSTDIQAGGHGQPILSPAGLLVRLRASSRGEGVWLPEALGSTMERPSLRWAPAPRCPLLSRQLRGGDRRM
jgi:hypothetical protein